MLPGIYKPGSRGQSGSSAFVNMDLPPGETYMHFCMLHSF